MSAGASPRRVAGTSTRCARALEALDDLALGGRLGAACGERAP